MARPCAPGAWQQPKPRTRPCGRGRRLTTMLVGLRLWLSPGDGGNRPLPQPVGQGPATKALHEVGALAQPPLAGDV
jgi:hypothetical protein